MSGSDVLVLAPWAAFGAGLMFICFRLLFLRRNAPRSPRRPPGADLPRTDLRGTTRPPGSVHPPMPIDHEHADGKRNTSAL